MASTSEDEIKTLWQRWRQPGVQPSVHQNQKTSVRDSNPRWADFPVAPRHQNRQ